MNLKIGSSAALQQKWSEYKALQKTQSQVLSDIQRLMTTIEVVTARLSVFLSWF